MQNNHEFIDVKCREVRTMPVHPAIRFLILALTVAAAVLCAGAAFDLWSGDVAMFGLITVAVAMLAVGRRLPGRRISGVFSLTGLVGMCGIALALTALNGFLSLFGVVLAGLSLVVLHKIDIRGWNHE